MKTKSFFGMIVCVTLAIGLVLAGCDTGTGGGNGTENNGGGSNNTDDSGANAKSITVNMQKPANWPHLYVYAWDDSSTEYAGAAPGTELTDSSGGFYSYHVPSAEYGYINVRFSDGGSNSTLDIQGVE
jgi:hypothetical protein